MYIYPEVFFELAKRSSGDLMVNDYCYVVTFNNYEIFVPHKTWGLEKYQRIGELSIAINFDTSQDELMSSECIKFLKLIFEAAVDIDR